MIHIYPLPINYLLSFSYINENTITEITINNESIRFWLISKIIHWTILCIIMGQKFTTFKGDKYPPPNIDTYI